jgi:hypothetical protein
VRLLEPVAPARLAAGFHRILRALLRRRTVLHRRTPLNRTIPIATVTLAAIAVATVAISVATAETALVAPEGPLVTVGVAVGVVTA